MESISVLDDLKKISGLKVNYEKSEIACLGSLKETFFQIEGKNIKFSKDHIKILGVVIPIDGNYKDTITKNFNGKITTIKSILKKWEKRKLTLYGNVIILKSLIVPQLIYLLTNLPNPNTKYFEEIEDIIIKFLWDGKKRKYCIKNIVQQA